MMKPSIQNIIKELNDQLSEVQNLKKSDQAEALKHAVSLKDIVDSLIIKVSGVS